MTGWKKEICSDRPLELQTVAPNTYIERRDIEEVEHEATEGTEAYTDWECESRFLSVDEYNMMKSIEAIDTQKAIDDFTMQLIEEGLL